MIRVTVNGKTIEVSGGNISITNDEIIVDGKTVQKNAKGVVKVEVVGDLVNLTSHASVSVTGNIKGDVDAGGSVTCNDVEGSIDAGGSVKSGKVGGNIDAGGSVHVS